MCLLLSCSLPFHNHTALEAVQACAKKKKWELEKLFFRKASVFFKLLGKTMFQVPRSIHISILRGLEAVQACAIFFRSLKNCFSATPDFIP